MRSTKPLVLGGSIVRGLEVEFRGGRAVRIDAEENADVLRGYAARDEGAARLGEVALVDGEGRIGALDTVFFDTLLDENAASHIALGAAYAFAVGRGGPRAPNSSAIHVDFMIGGAGRRRRPASTADGAEVAGAARRRLADLSDASRCASTAARVRASWRGAGAVERARLEIA